MVGSCSIWKDYPSDDLPCVSNLAYIPKSLLLLVAWLEHGTGGPGRKREAEDPAGVGAKGPGPGAWISWHWDGVPPQNTANGL